MSELYLNTLDDLLARGIEGLSRSFIDAQLAFVAAQQQPDGGFRGRLGVSDPYYCDFAMRILACLARGHDAIHRVARYMSRQTTGPSDLVGSFSILNLDRLLRRRGAQAAADHAELGAQVLQCLLPGGGFARSPGGTQVSAYHTFLAALCLQCMEVDMPLVDGATRAITALACPDGGFAELPQQATAQTNATAAATAFLSMNEALPDRTADEVSGFLARMQSPEDGGLKAHAGAAGGDLLSTFTGLLTLWGLGEAERIDLAAAARFVRATACPTGGFRACPADGESDLEYTYYGIGTLALLRLCAAEQGT